MSRVRVRATALGVGPGNMPPELISPLLLPGRLLGCPEVLHLEVWGEGEMSCRPSCVVVDADMAH